MHNLGLLLIEGSFGLPSVLLLVQLFWRLKASIPKQLQLARLRVTLGLLIVFLSSLGVLVFVLAFFDDLHSLLTCTGGGCAQAGMATFILVPVAWVGWLFAWLAARLFFGTYRGHEV